MVEILIGIVISMLMMAAMYTSYSIVNNTYSQVTGRATISRSGRDVVGMMMRDIRMAGFKYYGDTARYVAGDTASTLEIKSCTGYNHKRRWPQSSIWNT